MEFVGKYDDQNSMELAARITADLLASHPDLAGIGGFDSNTGPGMALAIKEANKQGKVFLTTVDAEEIHLRLVKEGTLHYLVGQKRELFTWMGADLLFAMRHPPFQMGKNDEMAGLQPVPESVDTGIMEIDSSNVRYF
ncbi:MAG: substrate-binding domain-containing protein [Synechococcaceae cyanobacterium SM2_3_60]|nr:substrate-binding domain-containing protein [Synechococcaceae cyanobacterium SM2_3_60]